MFAVHAQQGLKRLPSLTRDCCSGPACRLFNMGGCIRGWPVHVRNPPEAKHYYWVELGWYIHLTLKHVLG